ATFVIAARAAGCTAPLGELVALLMVVQTAMVIPLSIGGWGLREGTAAWAFAAAGLGAATGVTVATLYAVLMLAAVAPGAGLLLRDAVRRRRDQGQPGEALAGRAAREVKLVGDVDQLARGQLPAALGQPVGQVRRFHLVLAIPQRVLDRVKDGVHEVSLIARVVPIRARVYDPVRRPGR